MPEPDLEGQLAQGAIPAPPPSSGWDFIARGLAGAAAGYRGQPNPIVAEEQAQRRQQMEQIRLGMEVQRMRQQEKQFELGFYRDLITGESDEGRRVGARGIERHLKEMGQPTSPNFVESFVQRSLSADKRKEAYISILAADSEPTLAANLDRYLEDVLKAPKTMIPSLKAEAHSPAIHKLLYGKTLQTEQLELQKADLEQKKYDVLLRRQDVTDARLALSEAKETRLREEGQAKLALQERRVITAEGQLLLAQAKFEWLQAHGPEEKRLRGLDVADQYVNQFESAAVALDKKNFLAKGSAGVIGGLLTGDPSAAVAKTNQQLFPNDPDWVNITKTLRGSMVGFARNVEGDIGPRFKAAFDGIISLSENPPSLEALRAAVKVMRDAIKLNREGKDTAQTLYIKKPDGRIIVVPWKRGMTYEPGDMVVKVE